MPIAFEHDEDHAHYRRPAHRPGVELYHANIRRHSFDPHTHEAYGLGAITGGVGRFRWRGGEHLAPRATLMLMNPEDIHTGQAATEDAWGYRMVYLDESVLSDIYGGPAWRFTAAVAHDAEAATQAAALMRTLWHAREPMAFDAALLQLVQGLSRHAHRAAPRGDGAAVRFEPVIEFMRAHLDQSLDTARLAAVVGLSPFHFLRSFKAQHHATPQQALMALRLHEAKRLLARGEAPAQVAAAAGLTDQAHLTRCFSRRYGITPARYQQQLGTRPAP